MPSSRFNFCAARSNRAAWDSQGLISCSMEMVRIGLRMKIPARRIARALRLLPGQRKPRVRPTANAEYREGATGRQGEVAYGINSSMATLVLSQNRKLTRIAQ